MPLGIAFAIHDWVGVQLGGCVGFYHFPFTHELNRLSANSVIIVVKGLIDEFPGIAG